MFDIKLGPAGRPQRITGLAGCAEALALAQQARRRRIITLARDAAAAVRLVEQLRAVMDPDLVHHLVGWEVLPYDATSPPRAVATTRISTLALLRQGGKGVYVSAATDALLPCIPPRILAGEAFQLAVGEELDVKRLIADLSSAGCAAVDRVRTAGEFAIYGGQLDLYPGGATQPYRIVLDLNHIDQIRTFDPATQMSTGRCERVNIVPTREYSLDDESIVAFRQRWRERFPTDGADEIYTAISRGKEAEGAEFFLPLFHGKHTSLFDYLGHNDVIWLHHDLRDNLASFAQMVADRYHQACAIGHPALKPAEVFLDQEGLFTRLARHAVIEICPPGTPRATDLGAVELPPLGVNRGGTRPYARLAAWLADQRGRVVFNWSGQARKEQVLAALAEVGAQSEPTAEIVGRQYGTFIHETPLTGGFTCADANLTVVTEAELHDYVPAPRMTRSIATAALAGLDDLAPGDLVVHQQHGIARYHGLMMIDNAGFEEEFIHLEFANDVKLYVAVAHCHLVARYRKPESDEEVTLHTLGGKRWKRMQARAQQAARDTAAHLLDIYARRSATGKRPPTRLDEEAYASFCASFAHAETADQAKVSAEVVADLCSTLPMDRLVCGDVGFGKTEVALRAAWVAWRAGRQVAVIAPTTLLADQLHRSFVERFAGTGAQLYELSTLRSKVECDAVIAELAQGKPSIVIGTHSLLGDKVRIPKLGLVVIDEEHRFGVRQKERIRDMRAKVDILAMSATPIPRTLSMAYEGLRDMSFIATPPPDRLAVRTFVTVDGDTTVREALAREIARGGQVFYVHHRVQTIDVAIERVCDLVPEANVAVAHGQMPHARLEAVMRRFYRGEVDVLVCTTIIESGLDVGNANTIIMPRADMFGLAQLHQLRGRVGRTARQGYAYFLLPSAVAKKSKANARLLTLAEATHLGSGYQIAVRDLEIRGAGEILGEAQSGAVVDVGIETFKRMLTAAKRVQDTGTTLADCEVNFGGHARLPTNYCANAVERMRTYRTCAAAADSAKLAELRDQLADRFGPLPAPVRLLLDSHHLRLRAAALGITRIQAFQNGLKVHFLPESPCATALIELVQERTDCRLAPDYSLRISQDGDMVAQMRLALEFCTVLKKTMALAPAGE